MVITLHHFSIQYIEVNLSPDFLGQPPGKEGKKNICLSTEIKQKS
jgi:hypothetical protein